jgi:hypothetical protein
MPQAPAPMYASGASPGPPMAQAYPAQGYGMAPAPISDAQNTLAIVSFISGILGLCPFWIGFVLCIAAIVCGGFGIQHANRLPDGRGRGLAIAGLVLGLLFILPASCGL